MSSALSTFCHQHVVEMYVFSRRLKVLRLSSGSGTLSGSEFQVNIQSRLKPIGSG